jgi:hypothetical protein
MTDTSAAPIPNESLEQRQARLGNAVATDEPRKFASLQAFLAFCLDGEKNGTGAPRATFDMVVATERVEGADEDIAVIHIAPRGFAYLTQRFNINTEDGNGLIANDLIEAKKQYLANAARARAQQADAAGVQVAAEGVAVVRLGGGQ